MNEQHPIAEKDALVEAVKDLCWRAQRYGATEDGDTAYYLVTKGAMHRLVAACPGAAFRSDDSATIPDQGADYDAGRVSPSVLRQVISEAMNRAEAAGMDRRTTEEWIGIEILGSPLIPLATEVPLRTGEVECADVERSWFQQEYERSKKRNGALGAHGMVITGTGFDVPTRVLPPVGGRA